MSRSERFTFPGALGARLDGRLELPDGEPRAYALFAHCFTCSKDALAAVRISRALAELGIAVLRFDFTGIGASEGEFANTDFSSNIGDLIAAADHLRRTRAAPRMLIGHSLGGAAVLAAAAKIPEVVAVATIAAPADPGHVRHLLTEAMPEIEARGEAMVEIAGRPFRIRKSFLDDISAHSMDRAIANMDAALMVLHSPHDEIVNIENAGLIFSAAKHPKSFVSLDTANHLLTDRADSAYVAALLAAWASRYFGKADPEAPAVEEGVVLVRESGRGPLAQEIHAGPHMLRADEPVAAGGSDTGPSPYQLLSAALGACTSMTMRLYAERKGWPLDRVIVAVRHGRIHAEDCAECETREGRIDSFERAITLDGELDEDQRRRLLEIADRCPVHRTLKSEVAIVTELTPPGA